jgi:hypothetical protein
VRDDDELAVLPKLLVDLQQPPQIDLVEGGLDLVEDIERTWSGLEQRDEEGDGNQSPFAAGEQ